MIRVQPTIVDMLWITCVGVNGCGGMMCNERVAYVVVTEMAWIFCGA